MRAGVPRPVGTAQRTRAGPCWGIALASPRAIVEGLYSGNRLPRALADTGPVDFRRLRASRKIDLRGKATRHEPSRAWPRAPQRARCPRTGHRHLDRSRTLHPGRQSTRKWPDAGQQIDLPRRTRLLGNGGRRAADRPTSKCAPRLDFRSHPIARAEQIARRFLAGAAINDLRPSDLLLARRHSPRSSRVPDVETRRAALALDRGPPRGVRRHRSIAHARRFCPRPDRHSGAHLGEAMPARQGAHRRCDEDDGVVGAEPCRKIVRSAVR